MRFRPCIDLREGRVVQIVGGTLKDENAQGPVTNFETDLSPAAYARMYKADNLSGGHVISLGPGNYMAALSALRTFPGGMQMGGGITPDNAKDYLDAGASHVIVTSYVFREGQVDMERLVRLVAAVGKDHLVLDLSCRKRASDFWVVTNRWQRFTEVCVNRETLTWLAEYCDEFLVHGVDVEGKRVGIEVTLVEMLGAWSPIPVTYAGGARTLADLDQVKALGKGRVDLTIGSALDIFGGDVRYRDVVDWQRRQEQTLKRF
ncbi:phosphoribosylformimino-5-aminoimidazole carboxamide ribotide isomerase [Candidatus Poribacteria bacterium]|nr:phosphoribosylformimino-5-aminoimidazole carboxamide ribotide isomerase [Candidatus Poribacteria bacterium]